MTTSVQRRRGSTVQHSTFTGLEGEITIDTTKDTAVVHDGSTIGGFPLAKENLANANPSSLTEITGASTAADDLFLIYDASLSTMKKITRAELNNAIEVDALANVTITGGSINGTTVGASTASTGAFTTLSASGAFSANGGATLGDASGDALTINSSAVSVPNGLNFDSNTLVIDAANNRVGVGTASPSVPLDVVGNLNTSGRYVVSSSGTAGTTDISIGALSSGMWINTPSGTSGYLAVAGYGVYQWTNLIHAWSTSGSERMRIDSSGNLNLGQTTSALQSGGTGITLYGSTSSEIKFLNSTTGTTLTDGTALLVTGANFLINNRETGYVAINTSNTERMRIDSSGNVGIGTASPAQRLHVVAADGVTNSRFAGASYAIRIQSLAAVGASIEATNNTEATYQPLLVGGSQVQFTTSGTERMRIDSSGNVGIGTSSPTAKLHVAGAGSTYISVTSSNAGTGSGLYTANATNAYYIGAGAASGGSSLEFRDSTNSATRMVIDSSGNVGIGNTVASTINTENNSGNLVVGAGNTTEGITVYSGNTSIGALCFADGTTTTSTYAGYLQYLHASDAMTFGTGATERMRIDSSGNVGIGITSYSARLAVHNASSIGEIGRFSSAQGSGEIQLNLGFTTTNQLSMFYDIGTGDGGLSTNVGSANLIFRTATAERMRITSGGVVGIGVTNTSSSFRLDVGGHLRLQDGTGYAFVQFGTDTTATDNWHLGSEGDGTFRIYNGNFGSGTLRAYLTSGGEFIVGGFTDQGAYNLQCNGTGVWGAGAYVNGSDERIKENIAPLDSGLDVVSKLNPVTYKYKEDWSKDQSTQTGFIAQELLTALEGKNYVDGVVQQGGEYMSVAYQNIIPILTKAIQEQQAMIEELKQEVALLKSK